ncbi:TPA: helix-turn-helix transcriptional regulator [Pasteurella multocida]|uniref:XRE family transcriptional regulator n=1 Tax=Pasteurella multocida TaxID=747 RepID=UPI0009F30611|nr:helix-turn-helix transcriptional regulator [Pasteurella multocida]PNM02533.1 helix-turn-helix transcriptional regulator [Pasteurella multocida]HDX1017342.1 helix-turn-helix transcriptional regulator [Pasteurella multocida]HDX1018379.1 helix-turn-helix transcriptional regulator [Pasteurella multocida]
MSKPNIYDKDFSERMSLIAKTLFKDNYSEFARAVGVVQPSLVRWVKGEADTSRTNLIKIAEVTNVSVEWLLTGKGEMFKSAENTIKKNATSVSEPSNVVMIPSYSSIQVSAGFGSFNDGVTKPDDYIPYPTSLLQKLGVKPQFAAVFWANGTSMRPTIDDKDQMLVDLARKEIKGNNIYLVQSESSVWVKRIKMNWNSVELISDNQEEYKPIILSKDEAEKLQVIGLVTHVGKNMI